MIITETEINETLKPPIPNLHISQSNSRSPSPSPSPSPVPSPGLYPTKHHNGSQDSSTLTPLRPSLHHRSSSSPVVPPPLHPTLHYGSSSPVTPPGYAITTTTETITYIFEPIIGENAMLLHSARTNGRETRYPYYISVNLNCFTPSSHITSIRKYGRDGELVGDFEIAAKDSKHVNTVFLHNNEHPIDEVLVNTGRLFRNQWSWKSQPHFTLYWDDSSGGNTIACFNSKDRTNDNLFAKFIPRNHRRKPGREVEYPKLEVTPKGHEFFEDVLISALIIERLRTNV